MSGRLSSQRASTVRRTAVMIAVAAATLLAPVQAGTASATIATPSDRCDGATPVVSGAPVEGRILGIERPVVEHDASCAHASRPSSTLYNGGEPPLWRNKLVTMGTSAIPGDVTITPVFWSPASAPVPAKMQNLVTSFDANVASASGTTGNLFAVMTQYRGGGIQHPKHISYDVHAGAAIVDQDPFPTGGCTPDAGEIYTDQTSYTTCVSDKQIQAELSTLHPVEDLTHLYAVFLPEGVEVCTTVRQGRTEDGAEGGNCTANQANPSSTFCGYHAALTNSRTLAGVTTTTNLVYTVIPYAVWDSPTGLSCTSRDEFPQHDPAFDVAVSTYAHEIAEAITDPTNQGWIDAMYYEMADLCAYDYGSTSGSPGSLASQTINGAKYFIQTLFSNTAFRSAATGHWPACVKS